MSIDRTAVNRTMRYILDANWSTGPNECELCSKFRVSTTPKADFKFVLPHE